MKRIAVVGDIGSGKSYVAKSFGFPVFDADLEVSKLYKFDKRSFYRIKKSIPKCYFSFPIKKSEIKQAISANQYNLKKIVKIVHPAIRKKLNNFLKKYKSKKIVILDIPLLLENKINKKNDILVFVEAKKNQIHKKLKKRENFDLKLFKKFKKIQLPLEYKKKKSNFIVKNNFTNNSVKKSVKIILNKIL
jgi:dephospho-CoA kinase|tara:strand:+ start:2031 stop:2600 length:570 start_codon:yes stop_codon:yes gene_type:complete